MVKRFLLAAALLAGAAVFLPHGLLAQESDVIVGRVTGETGEVLVNARVEAMSTETEISHSVLTDKNGRYTIVFPDGGGTYVLRVTYLGYADFVGPLTRAGTEELLMKNVKLGARPIELDAVRVNARRQPGRGDAGEQSTELSQQMLDRLPLPDLDPNTLALLSAGVVSTQLDSLSGRMGFSVGGMSDLLNQTVLDGVNISESGVQAPEDGVRRTQVTTSTFDASRGGFAGGQVSMTTARGSNRAAGAMTYQLSDDALQLRPSANIIPETRHNVGGSIGGPLIHNKLFYNASFQFVHTDDHRFALTSDPASALAAGVALDSITRFLSILGNQYLFPIDGQTGAYDQLRQDGRFASRIDWNMMSTQSQAHTLSARFNYNLLGNDSTQIRALDLAEHGGATDNDNLLAAINLTSRLGRKWTNSLSSSYSEGWNNSLPYLQYPEGDVRIVSSFADATSRASTLIFGGNRSMPSDAYRRDLQLSDDLSLLLPIGDQLERIKIGASLQRTYNLNRSASNIFGTFTYNSLSDFENNLPSRYERTFTDRLSRTGAINTGLYIGDTWRISDPLELTFGMRWDRSSIDQTPQYNPLVEQLFGRRTDVTPLATELSPRLGFNYRLAEAKTFGTLAKTISGGVGVFAGRPPQQVYSQAARQTGLAGSDETLVCTGDAVPIPTWSAYLTDPNAVPTTCADGTIGAGTGVASRAPSVTLLEANQHLPSSVRAEIGYRTPLPFKLSGSIRYSYSHGIGLWGYQDLNLNESRTFRLAGENRLFFGSPGSIVNLTGATTLAGSRLHPEFGPVYAISSNLASSTHQLTAQIGGYLGRFTASANYTLTFARDEGSTSFFSTTTAGDPNIREWATSDNDRRHTLNLTLTRSFGDKVEITALSRISSGAPFTPLVDADINGDGARNDRAFIFNPAATSDTSIANGMRRLLATLPGSVASCLTAQLGQIAGRNTCRNPWSESLDLRANLRPYLPTLQHRMTISIDARNVLTGLDQLVHGADNLSGWGEAPRADATLLQVRGFDPATDRFIYQVNGGFGQTNRGPNSFRNPFSLVISARIAVGGQAALNNRGFGPPVTLASGDAGGGAGGRGGRGGAGGGGFGGGGGGFGGAGGDGAGGGPGGAFGDDFRTLLQSARANADSAATKTIANPVRVVIALSDSLKLTADQTKLVRALADSLDVRLARHRATLAAVMKDVKLPGPVARGAGFDTDGPPGGGRGGFDRDAMQNLRTKVTPTLDSARVVTSVVMQGVQHTLTAEQWQLLPTGLRNTTNATPRARAFNAVGMIDRMLANPITVLLTLKDTLRLTAVQTQKIQKISSDVELKLAKHRKQFGDKLNGVKPEDQARVFQQMQPDIQDAREQVSSALESVQKVLTKQQWEAVPEQVRNPFQFRRARAQQGQE